MVDLHSPLSPLTIHLPAELITEIQVLAQEQQMSVDEIVREACLQYTEPYIWERCYTEWRRTHSDPRS